MQQGHIPSLGIGDIQGNLHLNEAPDNEYNKNINDNFYQRITHWISPMEDTLWQPIQEGFSPSVNHLLHYFLFSSNILSWIREPK